MGANVGRKCGGPFVRVSTVVSISACHVDDPSIPARGIRCVDLVTGVLCDDGSTLLIP